jgi:two-component system CheB/CheR fusion protein
LKLEEFVHFLAEERDFDLRCYKPTTLERRIRKRMGRLAIPDYEGYIEYIQGDPGETNQLLDTVLINVTEFFRDPGAWDVIGSDILPYLLKRLRTGDSFRAWVAGCSTGEEVYSLAIVVAEHLGSRISEFDIKIYATDVDEAALDVARRGEYPPELLGRVRPEWRHKYFSLAALPRVNRGIRRMLIFGRNDLARDAPISHVQMVLCRNVLIYFNSIAQRHILNRLHSALDPGGILFLGKSELKLSHSMLFKPVDSRWKIFRKEHTTNGSEVPRSSSSRSDIVMSSNGDSFPEQEVAKLELHYRALLEVLRSGIFSLDANDVIITDNQAALELWGLSGGKLVGRQVSDSALGKRCPVLLRKIEESHKSSEKSIKFNCAVKIDGDSRTIAVDIRPVIGESGRRAGTVIYAENVSHREKLQTTIEQLEATGKELQSANQKLETTNEELQSTNEELETTNEELQSLNEELENMNEELEFRTKELATLNSRYAETLERLPWAVTVLDNDGRVQFWNSAAQKLFDMEARSVIGLELAQLPIQPSLRDTLVRRRKAINDRLTPAILRNQELRLKRSALKFDIHLTPLSRDSGKPSLLLMFTPQGEAARSGSNSGRKTAGHGAERKSAAKKNTTKR